ncbi:MAG: hypothetical protein J2P37_33605, partial [Ktedonobacteraceae bacterium]|nr:hypothetical protein [Ktedonobacteraceae bacterium]
MPDRLWCERGGERLPEKGGCLSQREVEVRSTYFVQDMTSAKSGQGERRIAAHEHHQMDIGWKMLKKKG